MNLDELQSNQKLVDGDVFTLIGHAVSLRGQGKQDMPRYFLDLAERIALAIGDRELAARVVEIRDKELK